MQMQNSYYVLDGVQTCLQIGIFRKISALTMPQSAITAAAELLYVFHSISVSSNLLLDL